MVITAIAAALVVVGVITALALVVLRRRRGAGSREIDYRFFFTIGIAFLASGAIFLLVCLQSDIPFALALPHLAMGLVYVTIGLSNRDKWKTR